MCTQTCVLKLSNLIKTNGSTTVINAVRSKFKVKRFGQLYIDVCIKFHDNFSTVMKLMCNRCRAGGGGGADFNRHTPGM
jgi:hypothetical protein